jgi:hypothetical protein
MPKLIGAQDRNHYGLPPETRILAAFRINQTCNMFADAPAPSNGLCNQ